VDASGSAVRYEILRDDRVIATVWGTSYVDTNAPNTAKYFVRAVDATDNRSASTAGVDFVAPGVDLNLVVAGSTWKYLANGTAAMAGWTSPATSLGGWATGAASFGAALGQSTTIPVTGTTQYFAQDFSVNNLSTVASLQLRLRVDDGAVAYLNGTEIGRTDMPFGTPTASTTAWAAQTGTPGWMLFNIPKTALVAGTNRLAVEVHQAVANDVDAFFDAELKGIGTSNDTVAPSQPVLTAPSASNTAISLSWTASTDNVGVVAYVLTRNGSVISYRQPGATLDYFDQQLTPGTTYTYTVAALDAAGNLSTVATTTKSTTGVAPPTVLTLVATGATYQYAANAAAPVSGWALPATTLSGWSTGAAPLGANLGQATTIPLVGVAQYFAVDFSLTAAQVSSMGYVQLRLKADDGAVAYINGQEMYRSNMPFGAPTYQTPAWAAVTTTPGWVVLSLPANALVAGANRLAVEVHQWTANDTDGIFDADLTGYPKTSDTVAPSAPTLTSSAKTRTSVTLNWTASTDNLGVIAYRLKRGSTVITIRQGSSSRTFMDQQLTPGTSYTYSVTAFDASGNESQAGTVTVTTNP
jgi:hypothetical protein